MRINRTTTPGSTRVGVGTATPAGTLGVDGDVYIGNQLSSGTSGTMRLVSSAGVNYIQSGTSSAATSAPFVISAIGGGAEWMRVTNSSVTIGASGTASDLTVYTTATSTATANAGATICNSGNTRQINLGVDDTNSTTWIQGWIPGTGASNITLQPTAGLVGIGTTTPGSTLDVNGGQIRVRATGSYSEPSANCGTLYYDSTGGNFTIDARSSSGSTALRFRTSSGGTGTEKMQRTAAGEVWIAGTTDQGAYNLQCNGTGVWGAGAYVNGSDSRIKHDINPIGPCLDLVSAIQPVTFIYNSDWSSDQTVQTGFIAQQLQTALAGQEYLDGIVSQGGEYLNVAYQNIIPLLTKSIQELKAIVDAQAARIAALEANA
jgi:hypothetical protein